MLMPPLTTSPFRGSGGAAAPPPPLSFGFGMHNNNTSMTAASSSSTSSPSLSFGNLSTLTSNAHSKRQRSVSPSEESDDTMDAALSTSAHSSSSRAFQALPKRMRAGLGGSSSNPSRRARISRSSQSPPASGPSTTADVGKMLATLDKASLLTVFSRLLTADPSSAQKIQSLIPTPTLSSVEAALEETQRTVRSLLWNASEMRNEFAWGRLRMPVAEFVTTAMSFLPFFVITDEDATNNPIPSREPPHPSTMYAFLHLITERALILMADLPESPTNLSVSLFSPDAASDGNPIVNTNESGTPKMILKSYHQVMSTEMEKLSAVNPNAIVSQLIPILLLHWARLSDWIARSVNEEGRMFGAETVRGWLAGLESLTTLRNQRSSSSETELDNNKVEIKACKTALCTLGQRMQEQIGWLVGRHAGAGWRPGNMEF